MAFFALRKQWPVWHRCIFQMLWLFLKMPGSTFAWEIFRIELYPIHQGHNLQKISISQLPPINLIWTPSLLASTISIHFLTIVTLLKKINISPPIAGTTLSRWFPWPGPGSLSGRCPWSPHGYLWGAKLLEKMEGKLKVLVFAWKKMSFLQTLSCNKSMTKLVKRTF